MQIDKVEEEKPREFGKLWPFLRYSFLASIALTVLYAAYEIAEFKLYYDLNNGNISEDVAIPKVAQIDLFGLPIMALFLIVLILSVIAYCRFHYRAMKNLHAIDAADLRTTPFWSVGTYFIPVVNLWKPLGAVRQAWRASLDPKSADVSVPAFIGWWWFAWLVSNFLDRMSMRLVFKSGFDEYGIPLDIDVYLGSIVLSLLAAPFTVVAAFLVLRFSKAIMVAQQQNVLTSSSVATPDQ